MINRECYVLCPKCKKHIILFPPLEVTKKCECGYEVTNYYNVKLQEKE